MANKRVRIGSPEERAIAKHTAKPTQFPHVELVGGPHGKDIELRVNGEKVDKVYRVELDADVNDAIRLRVFQYVRLDVKVEGDVQPRYKAHLSIPKVKDDQWVYEDYEAVAGTIQEAVQAAVQKYEEHEPKEGLL